MGQRGPRPAPKAVKLAKGAQPCRINFDEPPALPGDPESPLPLTGEAEAEWARLLPILRNMGVLSASDGAALALYCVTFARWRRATAEIERIGLTVESGSGSMKLNPLVVVAGQLEAALVKLAREFGLTPSARTGLKAAPAAEVDEVEAFVARRRKTSTPSDG